MPGHISLYLKKFRTLVSGDALAIENGELEIAVPQFTLNIAEAKESVSKLLEYDLDRIICYYGWEYQEAIPAALRNAGNC